MGRCGSSSGYEVDCGITGSEFDSPLGVWLFPFILISFLSLSPCLSFIPIVKLSPEYSFKIPQEAVLWMVKNVQPISYTAVLDFVCNIDYRINRNGCYQVQSTDYDPLPTNQGKFTLQWLHFTKRPTTTARATLLRRWLHTCFIDLVIHLSFET